MGITDPDVIVVLFPEGLAKERARIAQMRPDATLYIAADLMPVETPARVVTLDFSQTDQSKAYWAIMALAAILRQTDIYPRRRYKRLSPLAPMLRKTWPPSLSLTA